MNLSLKNIRTSRRCFIYLHRIIARAVGRSSAIYSLIVRFGIAIKRKASITVSNATVSLAITQDLMIISKIDGLQLTGE